MQCNRNYSQCLSGFIFMSSKEQKTFKCPILTEIPISDTNLEKELEQKYELGKLFQKMREIQ